MRFLAVVLVTAVLVGVKTAGAAEGKLANAAVERAGARVSAEVGPKVVPDKRTTPWDACDGNLHSRYVVTGVPYTIKIELVDALPVEKVSFAQSDYESEAAPKDITIKLDDGTTLDKQLEVLRPEKRKPAWQDVAIGKTVRKLEVTIKSNHPGKVGWGGIGEIAVFTSADLEAKLRVPGHDPAAAAFVRVAPPPKATVGKVTLPPPAKPGDHPCLLFTPAELTEFRQQLAKSERGRAALQTLVDLANGAAKATPKFPDPKGPQGQMKSRGDEVAAAHSALSRSCGNLGVAYALTGDKKYAARAAEILRGYAERYDEYPEHRGVNRSDSGKIMAQRLSEAMWLIPQIEAYDYIYASGALSDTDKRLVEQKLIRPCVTFLWRKEPAAIAAERDRKEPGWRTATPERPEKRRSVGNWLLFYNAATIMAGATLGDRDLVDVAAANMRQMIVEGVGDDGMWNEGAVGYQFFAMQAMTPAFEVAARQGIDLWSFDNQRVKMLFDSPRRYAYPDGSMPGINDSGRSSGAGWQTMIYDYALLRYGDTRYAALINESPRQLQHTEAIYFPTRIYEPVAGPPRVEYPSTVFADLGYAIHRNPQLYALMDCGPHGGTHGHFDKLNLILFGLGDELGGEPKFHKYEDPLHGQWTVETIGHNTITVDGHSQARSSGKLLLFEDAPGIKLMRAETTESYAGVLLDRTVVLVGDVAIDLMRGRSLAEHTWDRTLRFNGALEGMPQAGEATVGKADGYQHLKLAARQAAEQSWQGVWKTKGGRFTAVVAGAPKQEALLALGPDEDQVALLRQTGRSATFAALYDLAQQQTGSIRVVEASPGVTAITANLGQRGDVLLVVADAPGAWKAAGWESDARALCVVSRAGQPVEALLCGGTSATSNGQQLRLSAVGNGYAKAESGRLKMQ